MRKLENRVYHRAQYDRQWKTRRILYITLYYMHYGYQKHERFNLTRKIDGVKYHFKSHNLKLCNSKLKNKLLIN